MRQHWLAYSMGGVVLLVMVWLLLGSPRVETGAAMVLPTATPAATATPTPTLTPTPTVTPTPTPVLLSWTLAGTCSYMRAAPNELAEIVGCVPNGTQLTPEDEAETQWAIWYRVTWEGITGWMADMVLWDIQPTAYTISSWRPMYSDNGTIAAWLPPHTPVIVITEEERLTRVTLPNGEQGWLLNENLMYLEP